MDLSTQYMGLKLASPLVPSSSPLSQDISRIRQMEDHGAGAVVLWSLFEEQLRHEEGEIEHYLSYGTERFPESLTYYPMNLPLHLGPEQYLEHIQKAKQAVNIPIIASLNGLTVGGWTSYAKDIQEAGADALELNVYYIPAETETTSQQVEDLYLSILTNVKKHVTIPVAMKLSPFFSAMGSMAKRLDEAGADGLVLFNRFYQPDLDVGELEVVPSLSLSSNWEMRLPLRWIAILCGKIRPSIGASTGIYSGVDVAKVLLAGADTAMTCSALLRNGVSHLATMKRELAEIMEEKGYESVQQMKGVLSQRHVADPTAFERANYMKTLNSYGMTATLE